MPKNLNDLIDWVGLAELSGLPVASLRAIITRAILPPPTPVPTPQLPGKKIHSMSVNARDVFLQTSEPRVLAVTDSPTTFDRVCVKESGFVCFSSTRVDVAKTTSVSYHDLPEIVARAWDAVQLDAVGLAPTVFRNLPRELAILNRPAYRRISIDGIGKPEGTYPREYDVSHRCVPALKWRRWSRVLKLHEYHPWKSTMIHPTDRLTPSVWVLQNKDLMIVEQTTRPEWTRSDS